MPDITYDSEMRFHLNGQTVELMHFGPAHTTGDTAVFFREANVLHMGDVFINTAIPLSMPITEARRWTHYVLRKRFSSYQR